MNGIKKTNSDMTSRDKILNTVRNNQPAPRDLPELPAGASPASEGASTLGTSAAAADLTSAFLFALEAIGAGAFIVSGYERIAVILHEQFPDARRIVTSCPPLAAFAESATKGEDPHLLENVDVAILPAHFGVAENGACWITEAQMIERVLPFIAQHLVLILPRNAILADMHAAYERIAALEAAVLEAATVEATTAEAAGANREVTAPEATAAGDPTNATAPYGFATFIAGPSKTADIEQSLVLGAHGPMSLTVFLVDEHLSDEGYF